jgi:hypothetical protein
VVHGARLHNLSETVFRVRSRRGSIPGARMVVRRSPFFCPG